MKLYLASVSSLETDLKQAESGRLIFNDAYILQSFYYVDNFTEKVILPNCKDFILDSGAFTFMQNAHKTNINWDDYVERYAKFVKKHHIEKYFELDIDSIVGLQEVERLRAKLESLVGWQCIPVWHRSRGIEQYYKIADEYSYIAVGGIASKDIKQKEYPIFTKLINEAHKRGTKVHGLGFTSMKGIRKYHFDSVDSTTWASGNRFGAVYKFSGKTMIRLSKPPNTRVKSSITAINNFCEWKKFSYYAEKNL